MTNKAFIQSLANRLDIDEAEAIRITQQFIGTIMQNVQGGSVVSIQGFGNFEMKTKAERKMYNPATKSFSIIPSKSVLGFKMSATLKSRINDKNSDKQN